MKLKDIKPALRLIGGAGLALFVILYALYPSWPTPDKLFVFLFFVFLALGQTVEFLKKFAPFVAMLLTYEAFRGLVPSLNSRVEYQWMIDVDRWLGGGELPTSILQNMLWNGSTQWYDFALYFVYMLHFILPLALAVYIWKRFTAQYWQYVWSFISLSFLGFLTFLTFPAAPPWLASEKGLIEPITRVSSEVWARLGITDFPSVYDKISPNPVAAVPSLHAAYATLFCLFVFKLLGRKWGTISLAYPFAIYFGTVYQGEHYAIDEILGALYALFAFWTVAFIFKLVRRNRKNNSVRHNRTQQITKSKSIGVSFSLIACREYGVAWEEALHYSLQLGFRRFRIMSYWNVHEAEKGVFDFSLLDKQLAVIEKNGGSVSLCLGIRQPRWPETHLPKWTKDLSKKETTKKYLEYHKKVIERYKKSTCIESWQLENEYWLRSFGKSFDFSRGRLRTEFDMIRRHDPERPIIMTLARVVSLPVRRPTPDIYGTSMYRVIYNKTKKNYTQTWASPFIYRSKRLLIKLLKNRELIIHELQTEPWGPKANWEMELKEQFRSIDEKQIAEALAYARKSNILYIDMWGAEWWYWLYKKYAIAVLPEAISIAMKAEEKA